MLGIGCMTGIAGLLLWSLTGDVETPIISLPKVGVVLAVIGSVDVVLASLALALAQKRHKPDES